MPPRMPNIAEFYSDIRPPPLPPEFQVALKPKVERCTESDKVAFRALIGVTSIIKKYIEF
jgi:hypothetical protein